MTSRAGEADKGFLWKQEYLSDNGPWFDEQGRHSESPAFNKGLLAVRQSKGQSVRLYWGLIQGEYKARNGRDFLNWIDVVLLFGSMVLLPVRATQNFSYAIAKRRSRAHWPKLVRERLGPMGPISRLVDLEPQRQ